jgi:hypothetical protein
MALTPESGERVVSTMSEMLNIIRQYMLVVLQKWYWWLVGLWLVRLVGMGWCVGWYISDSDRHAQKRRE